MWSLVGPGILVLTVIGFTLWDRATPPSASPDRRMIRNGIVLAAIGTTSLFLWWLLVPVAALLVGASWIVIGRHRVVSTDVKAR